ncbi:hypothetical protein ABIA41_001587 [Bradyrhizobium sp. USDA 313]
MLTMSMSRERKWRSVARRNSGVTSRCRFGWNAPSRAGPHVVQHENGADARQKWAQQVVRSAEIECSQPGADDVVTQLFHERLGDSGIPRSTYGRTLEEKVIPIVQAGPLERQHFRFDSLPRVCFVSVSRVRVVECRSFSGGPANGG